MLDLASSDVPAIVSPMGRPTPSLALRIAASFVIIGACVLLAIMYDAIKSATSPDQWPNSGSLEWASIESCNESLAGGPPDQPSVKHPEASPKSANTFTLHMFFMTLAFGFFGPVSSVLYYVLEDTLKLNHDIVKWIHGLIQMAAVVTSVLGFLQIYYSAGGWCSFGNHFLSLHSYVGICVLAVYWLQGPLALLIFSNKVLLKPGTWPRKLFLRAHVQAGVALTLLGPVVIMLGILAFETKRTQWEGGASLAGNDFGLIWYKFVNAGMVAFGLMLLVGVVHANKPQGDPPVTGQVNALGVDSLLGDDAAKPPMSF